MNNEAFVSSPFRKYFPISWEISRFQPPVHSITHSHGLRCKVHFYNLRDEINHDRDYQDRVLIAYEVNKRIYNLFTLGDFDEITYALDETGIPNMKGDLAERVARRLMKRFLQRFHGGFGRLGGLFNKEFNPKQREGFVVANTDEYVLKVGKYPNMILLRKTGAGKWGYQHVTDLDGLFDYRYANKRHLIILESKTGRIDVNAGALYETLFVPLQKLFPQALFSYVLFADRSFLLDTRRPEYRILQDAPLRIHQALAERHIPSFFFHFQETEDDFLAMCRHLITSYRTYHRKKVSFHGRTSVSDAHITIYGPGGKSPYLELEKDEESGLFRVIHSPIYAEGSED